MAIRDYDDECMRFGIIFESETLAINVFTMAEIENIYHNR